jgi:hypothetical protein
MERRRKGIRGWEPREENPFESKDRGYSNRDEVPADLREWAGAWATWWEGIAGEVSQAFQDFESDDERKRYKKAIARFIRCGDTMMKAGRKLLDDLSKDDVYGAGDTRSEEEGGGVITDTTKPPPPPFGKGR